MTVYLVSVGLLLASCFYSPWILLKLLAPTDHLVGRRRWLVGGIGCACELAVVLTYCWLMVSGIYTLGSPAIGALYNAAGLLFVVHIYITLCTVAAGLCMLLGAGRSRHLRLAAGIGSLVVPAAAVAYGFCAAQTFEVTRLSFKARGLERPVTFVHLPDVHLGHQRGADYLKKIFAAVQAYRPDFILYNGDLFDSNAGLNPEVFQVMAALKIPQYFTSGNHEYYMDTARSFKELEAAGIRILRSENVSIGGLQLVGLEFMNADAQRRDPHSVNSVYMNVELPKIAVDRTRPIVLAHHSPVGLSYAAEFGADVFVAGHTHAGQIFPATLLVGLNFPFYKGVDNVRGMKVVVSQGAGTFGPWMRLGSNSEVQIVTVE